MTPLEERAEAFKRKVIEASNQDGFILQGYEYDVMKASGATNEIVLTIRGILHRKSK